VIGGWDVLLSDEAQRHVVEEVERTWARLRAGTRETTERVDRAWAGLDGDRRDVLSRVWALHHSLGGGIVVVGSMLGLVLCAATLGTPPQLARSRWLAARGARSLSRSGARAIVDDGWVAATFGPGRFVATDSGADAMRSLTALITASELDQKSQETRKARHE